MEVTRQPEETSGIASGLNSQREYRASVALCRRDSARGARRVGLDAALYAGVAVLHKGTFVKTTRAGQIGADVPS
jgi:hypothetical protein